MKNYLVLTPDGMGSTYLQRLLTVYLNLAGYDYTNTHELLNGLDLVNGGLQKNFRGYDQSVEEITELLLLNKSNLVSRIANYHVKSRLRKKTENYFDLYRTCETVFCERIMCLRDPFEYALSWGIRNLSKTLNVYSIQERIAIHPEGKIYDIDPDYFVKKLKDYSNYMYWCEDNFKVTQIVNYTDLHTDPDPVLQKITGLDFTFEDVAGINIVDRNRILYNTSVYIQTKDKSLVPDKAEVVKYLELNKVIKSLIKSNKLTTDMPIKMNTLVDKSKKVKNFETLVDTYNNWAKNRNDVETVDWEKITTRISEENKIYEPKNS